jgi:RNA polymerase sigma-70 factor, ECF subfamily
MSGLTASTNMAAEPAQAQTALSRARGGDNAAFAAVVEPHEAALFRHCYRMLGSGPEAEDAVQEALLRAWRRLDTFDATGPLGAWLYRIATNVCLDLLRAQRARVEPEAIAPPSDPRGRLSAPDPELAWVEPIGDRLASPAGDPEDEIIRQEDISLAFVAALQRLTPSQRACLLLHEVLGFSHAEVAEVLDLTVAGVNSTLFRARKAARPRDETPLLPASDPRLHQLLDRYLNAWRLADIDTFIQLVADDVRFSMPPLTAWFAGRHAVATFVDNAIFAAARPHGVTLRPGSCNRQPAFATYESDAAGSVVVNGLQVLEVRVRHAQPAITSIVSYRDPNLAIRCGFPARIA